MATYCDLVFCFINVGCLEFNMFGIPYVSKFFEISKWIAVFAYYCYYYCCCTCGRVVLYVIANNSFSVNQNNTLSGSQHNTFSGIFYSSPKAEGIYAAIMACLCVCCFCLQTLFLKNGTVLELQS